MNTLNHRVLEEFYDFQKNPNCLVNLIADPAYQGQIEEFRGEHEVWLREVKYPLLSACIWRQDPKVLAEYKKTQQLATQK